LWNLIHHPVCSFVADTPPGQEGQSFSLHILCSVAFELPRSFGCFFIDPRRELSTSLN